MYLPSNDPILLTPASSQGSSATILPSNSVASSKNYLYEEPERGRSLSRSSSGSSRSSGVLVLPSPSSIDSERQLEYVQRGPHYQRLADAGYVPSYAPSYVPSGLSAVSTSASSNSTVHSGPNGALQTAVPALPASNAGANISAPRSGMTSQETQQMSGSDFSQFKPSNADWWGQWMVPPQVAPMGLFGPPTPAANHSDLQSSIGSSSIAPRALSSVTERTEFSTPIQATPNYYQECMARRRAYNSEHMHPPPNVIADRARSGSRSPHASHSRSRSRAGERRTITPVVVGGGRSRSYSRSRTPPATIIIPPAPPAMRIPIHARSQSRPPGFVPYRSASRSRSRSRSPYARRSRSRSRSVSPRRHHAYRNRSRSCSYRSRPAPRILVSRTPSPVYVSRSARHTRRSRSRTPPPTIAPGLGEYTQRRPVPAQEPLSVPEMRPAPVIARQPPVVVCGRYRRSRSRSHSYSRNRDRLRSRSHSPRVYERWSPEPRHTTNSDRRSRSPRVHRAPVIQPQIIQHPRVISPTRSASTSSYYRPRALRRHSRSRSSSPIIIRVRSRSSTRSRSPSSTRSRTPVVQQPTQPPTPEVVPAILVNPQPPRRRPVPAVYSPSTVSSRSLDAPPVIIPSNAPVDWAIPSDPPAGWAGWQTRPAPQACNAPQMPQMSWGNNNNAQQQQQQQSNAPQMPQHAMSWGNNNNAQQQSAIWGEPLPSSIPAPSWANQPVHVWANPPVQGCLPPVCVPPPQPLSPLRQAWQAWAQAQPQENNATATFAPFVSSATQYIPPTPYIPPTSYISAPAPGATPYVPPPQWSPWNESGHDLYDEYDDEYLGWSPKHTRFWYADGNVTVVVANTTYKLHRYLFENSAWKYTFAAHMAHIPSGQPRYLAENKPDFDRFLSILYPLDYGKHECQTAEEWTSVLVVADHAKMESVRRLAIDQLAAVAGPVDKITLGHRYGVPEWLAPAYLALAMRKEPLTATEGAKLGVEALVRVAALKDEMFANLTAYVDQGKFAELFARKLAI